MLNNKNELLHMVSHTINDGENVQLICSCGNVEPLGMSGYMKRHIADSNKEELKSKYVKKVVKYEE